MTASPRTATAAVVGGGPAGLMAAEVLATAGCEVHLFEHMPSVGRKLLLAGRSGLNLTHSEPLAELLLRYGDAPQVQASVEAFPPSAVREWSAGLGSPTFVGSTGRVFPDAFRATPLLRAWLERLRTLQVQVHVRHRWTGWSHADMPIDGRQLCFARPDGSVTHTTAHVTVLALGGASWPRVGSDGGWVSVIEAAGVRVRPLRPSNVGLRVPWSQQFAERFAGVPLKNVALVVGGVGVRGDLTLTAQGLESGPVYTHTAAIRDSIERHGTCRVTIDLCPDLTAADIEQRLDRRRPKDSTATALRRTVGLTPAAVALLHEATHRRLPRASHELAELIHAVPLDVPATMPLARAISTAGGIALDELDNHLMLRALPGVFVAGEMLDWEAPTGGYLLQASLSTGVAAANGALAWIASGRRPADLPQPG